MKILNVDASLVRGLGFLWEDSEDLVDTPTDEDYLKESLLRKYRPHAYALADASADMRYFYSEEAQQHQQVVVTSARYAHEWAALPPNVTLEVWNGRTPNPISIVVWALYMEGVPLATAKSIAKSDKFGPNPPKGKYQDLIKRAWDRLQKESWAPTHRIIRPEITSRDYHTVEDLPDDAMARYLENRTYVAFDIETTGLDYFRDDLVGVSICDTPGTAYWIPCPNNTLPPNVAAVLAHPMVPKVAHGGKYDYAFLKAHGYTVQGIEHDTLLMAYMLGIYAPGHSRKLKDLAEHLLDVDVVRFADVVEEGKSFADAPPEKQLNYACQDVDLTLQLVNEFLQQFNKAGNERLFNVYQDIEVPLVPILGDMELVGAPVNVPAARDLARRIRQEIELIEGAMWEVAGQEFDPDKPQDLRFILYDKLGMQPVRETKTGYSTDKWAMDEMRSSHQLVSLILEWRGRKKLLSTFVGPVAEGYGEDAVDERVHSHFNQTIVLTGRLSSDGPNLQQQPPAARRMYQAAPGTVLLAADYSQQELRILAHGSQDPNMLEAFSKGEDIHQQTANLLGISRKQAKIVNFGIPYGAGPKAVARQAKCSVDEASKLLQAHKSKYPVLWEWIDDLKRIAHTKGYSESLLGRRRLLPGLYSNLPEVIASAEREAANMVIQGSAADVTKLAMKSVAQMDASKIRMIMQVHDELVFEVLAPEEVEALMEEVCERMTYVGVEIGCSVPLLVDAHYGKSWAELKG